MTDVLIKRELLELSLNGDEQQQAKARNKLREQLAAPRQPEGEGLEVVGYASECGLVVLRGLPITGAVQIKASAHKVHDVPLCRLSDAQRAIAELREECERLGRTLYDRNNDLCACEAERDTLRQQRNKMVGLLMEADSSFVDGSEAGLELSDRIHAALEEVSK